MLRVVSGTTRRRKGRRALPIVWAASAAGELRSPAAVLGKGWMRPRQDSPGGEPWRGGEMTTDARDLPRGRGASVGGFSALPLWIGDGQLKKLARDAVGTQDAFAEPRAVLGPVAVHGGVRG